MDTTQMTPGSAVSVTLSGRKVTGTVIRQETRGFDRAGNLNVGYWVSVPSQASEWGTAVIWVEA
jgi:hypothetical protein